MHLREKKAQNVTFQCLIIRQKTAIIHSEWAQYMERICRTFLGRRLSMALLIFQEITQNPKSLFQKQSWFIGAILWGQGAYVRGIYLS